MHDLRHHVPREDVDLRDAVYLVSEEFHPVSHLVLVRREDLQHVSPHPEGAAVEVHVVPRVLDVDEPGDDLVPVLLLPRAQRDHHLLIVHRAAQAVDAGDTGHHDDVLPLQKGAGGGVPELVDLVVDGGILLDIGVRGRNVGLRLIVVVVRDKVLHRVLGEEFLHLTVELRRQGLVVGNDEGRLLKLLDHVRHGEGLSGSGHAHQRLKLISLPETLHQLFDGLRLVPGGLII